MTRLQLEKWSSTRNLWKMIAVLILKFSLPYLQFQGPFQHRPFYDSMFRYISGSELGGTHWGNHLKSPRRIHSDFKKYLLVPWPGYTVTMNALVKTRIHALSACILLPCPHLLGTIRDMIKSPTGSGSWVLQTLLSFLLNTTQIWQEPQETNNTTYQTQIKRCCFTDPKAQLCIGVAFSHWSLDHHCTCNKANLTVWILISTRHHGSNSVIHHCYNVQVKLLKHEPQSVVECLRKKEGALNTPKWAEKTAHISSLDGLS